MMSIGYVFLCHILFFSFYANTPFAYGASATNCPGRRYGPCLSSSAATSTTTQMLLQDERRVQAINSDKRGGVSSKVEYPFISNLVGSGEYLFKVGFGTPPQYFNLILDTGSYITWVKCQPSVSNTSTSDSNYNLSLSSTYGKGSEYYKQSYHDKSWASGFFVHDKLTILDDDDKVISDVYSNFSFLCVQETYGNFSGAAGLLGLGKAGSHHGDYSFISQTKTKGFCHCMPSTGKKGYLYFGKDLEKCRNSNNYTPLLSNADDPSSYYVNLIAITIGQKKVNIASSSSSSASSSSPSTIIDSGTVITRLPPSVYSALESEFKELMSGFPLADPDDTLTTCYNLMGHDHNVTIPNMVLHFENNLDINLDQTEVTLKVSENDMSQVCLAFAGENGLTIIGNHQLQKLNVFYNIEDQRVEIGPGNC